MTEKKTPQRRTQVKDLPKEKKELSKEEQKNVKGGSRSLYMEGSLVADKPKSPGT